jgi:hypothetical protein
VEYEQGLQRRDSKRGQVPTEYKGLPTSWSVTASTCQDWVVKSI